MNSFFNRVFAEGRLDFINPLNSVNNTQKFPEKVSLPVSVFNFY